VEPTVRVRLFATARLAAGTAELRRPVPAPGIDVRTLLGQLRREFPALGPVLRSARFVRNGELLRGRSGRLRPGDELAIHPPYSGG
jgi:molybdopterin converting factor small subunit